MEYGTSACAHHLFRQMLMQVITTFWLSRAGKHFLAICDPEPLKLLNGIFDDLPLPLRT